MSKTKKWEDLKEDEEKCPDDGQRAVEVDDSQEEMVTVSRKKKKDKKVDSESLETPTPKKLFSPEKSQGKKTKNTKNTPSKTPDSPENVPASSGRSKAVRKLALLNSEISQIMDKLKPGPHEIRRILLK